MVFDNDFPGSKELRQPTFLTVIHSTQSSSRRSGWLQSTAAAVCGGHSIFLTSPTCWDLHYNWGWTFSNELPGLSAWTLILSPGAKPQQLSIDPSSGSIRLRCSLSHSLDYSFCVLTLRKHLADFTSVTPVSYSSLLILQQQLTSINAHWRNGFTSLVPVSSKSELTLKPQLPKPQILNSKYHTNSLNRVFEGHSNFPSQLPITYLHLSQHSYLPRSPTAVH